MSKGLVCVLVSASFLFISCSSRNPGEVTNDWLMTGRTYDNHRYSPLNQINEQTVGKLGLVWSHEMGSTRGLEATPLVEGGVLYTTGTWSVVDAIDAKTGVVRWTYDPKVPRDRAYFICCDVVNRGVALNQGKVYVGTLDGRLIALDEKNGSVVWSTATTDPDQPYSITSAPLVAKGMVIIGNAGGEYGVRGYLSAYDAETGKLVWRTYTVPGDPTKGSESKALEAAAKTWSGEYWKTGGGGNPWEGVTYDPALDLLYFGTSNATAWYRALRGGGDSLYTASIVAVHASNGEMAWHFQTTPGDNWDYDATQPLVLADLTIDGQARKVLMQANKNGFFYVLDRQTGAFVSGAAFASGVTWATGLDPKTGRPTEAPGVAEMKPVIASPGPAGAHNWNPIAFSPATGLVYLAAKSGTQFVHAPDAKWKYNPAGLNLGLDPLYDGPLNAKLATLPPAKGELVAWDPVKQQAAWRAAYPTIEGGGVVATGGNLIFQGRADGILAAYRATDGQPLWQFDTGTGIIAAPMTYSIDGTQYVSVMAGWGGSSALFNAPGSGPVKPGYGRIVTFALNGSATLQAPAYGHKEPPAPALKSTAPPKVVHEGGLLFNAHCAMCHGINAVAGPVPDLRYANKGTLEQIDEIVLHGKRATLGMPSFEKILDGAQVHAIQAYIIARAQEAVKEAGHH